MYLRYSFVLCNLFILTLTSSSQVKWLNVDSLFQPLPSSVHVYRTADSLDGKPNIAYYVVADLKDKQLDFIADTTYQRRLTPSKFYEKNNKPVLVVNCTFFSFQTNQNLNVVISEGKLVSFNPRIISRETGDTSRVINQYRSAIGIDEKRRADIAWIKTDSSAKYAEASQYVPTNRRLMRVNRTTGEQTRSEVDVFSKWKMKTAVGGGPVLIQNGSIRITNDEEKMFAGKAINDKHPRTAMGYTKDNKLIVLVIQGRFPGIAEGATLNQEAQLLKDLGCWEALNLDGGGSSCMLINGKETIKVSDATGQRPVPAVFLIKKR